MALLDKRQHFIGGNWCDGQGKERTVVNPATEQDIAIIALATDDEVEAAVQAAKAARQSFASLSVAERKALLASIETVYKRRRKEIGQSIMIEMGAPIDLACGAQAGTGQSHLRNFQTAMDEVQFEEELPNGDTVLREAIGVAGMITPWNWPIHQICLKVIAAFAAGCPVVLKPSESTPLNAMILADIMKEAGVPDGVFNLINGDGQGAGVALARHPDIDIISFTGSTAAGTSVAREAAGTLKKVALELGGKSPSIVFDDADLERAISSTIKKLFFNSGQNCNAPTRLLVQESVYEKAKEIAAHKVWQYEIGLPSQHGRHMGPVANEKQFAHVQRLIETGIREDGATLLVGGPGKPEGFETGYFVRPTLFANCTNDMQICKQEIFGPVLTMMSFEDEEDAIALANDTEYGLAAYVYSVDEERLARVMRALRAGMVFANGADLGPGSPFGGYKKSGLGREGGRIGIEEYLELKVIA